jgi:hypothetical protein
MCFDGEESPRCWGQVVQQLKYQDKLRCFDFRGTQETEVQVRGLTSWPVRAF